MENIEPKIKTHAESTLKRTFIRRKNKNSIGQNIEPVWMTNELRVQISLRKEYNRKKEMLHRNRLSDGK